MNTGSLLKFAFANSLDYSDIFERQGVISHSHRNLDSNAFIFREQNCTIVPATMEEIRDVDKLLDFKHDMKKIIRVHMKSLEGKKNSNNVL
jgi:hypothetical protein